MALPELGIKRIKAKVDTGARTSALHAFYTKEYARDGAKWVEFGLHPKQNSNSTELICHAPIHDERWVTDSGGHKELRYVIFTTLVLGEATFQTEFTLTNRDTMKFRMLLGRSAMKTGYVVAPGKSFLLGKP